MLKKWLLVVDLKLADRQIYTVEHHFRLSDTCFGSLGQKDNQNFEHWSEPLQGKSGIGWFYKLSFHALCVSNQFEYTIYVACVGLH